MAAKKALEVQQKKELAEREEKTAPGKYFVPYADIFETDEALSVLMEIPGVTKENVDVKVENDVLSVDGRIDHTKYEGLTPVYTEYNVGHFSRRFSLSSKIDQENISATVEDGVLTLVLNKAKEAQARSIPVR